MSKARVEVITFRSTREDHPYLFPIMALFYGYSTGHIALRITFEDQELYARYIQNNPRIPSSISVNPRTGAKSYQVYLSFWPDQDMPWLDQSMFVSHRFDCEMSGLNSPAGAGAFTRNFTSRMPLLNGIIFDQSNLAPSLMLHTSRLNNAYGDTVLQVALEYQNAYLKWRKAQVYQHNAEALLQDKPKIIAKYKYLTAKNKIQMLNSEKTLARTMFPNAELSHTEFMQRIEPFFSFGYPEQDSVTLKVNDVEPMLEYIKNVADDPRKFAYSLLFFNCANIAYNTLIKGIKSPAMDLPWYVRLLGITITPGLVLQHAIKAKQQLEDTRKNDAIDDEESQLKQVTATKLRLENSVEPLEFSNSGCAPTKVMVLANLSQFAKSKGI